MSSHGVCPGDDLQAPVVQKPISAQLGFLFLVFKSIFSDFSTLFLELPIINLWTNTKVLFKLSNLNSNLALTLGYLNPALNYSARTDRTGWTIQAHSDELN